MPTPPIEIQLLLLPELLGTSPTLISEMLVAAENAAIARRIRKPRLRIHTLGLSKQAVTTPAGIALMPENTIANVEPGQLIFIPALWRQPQPPLLQHTGLISFLQNANKKGSTIAAVSSGSYILAASGLLDKKPATTHWYFFNDFEKRFPTIKLKRDYFITQADNIYCAASINSMADLIVHFAHQLYNREIAQHVQRQFSHEIRRAYESMRYFEGSSNQHGDEDILQVQVWLQDQYSTPIQFSDVAKQFDMSVRSFNRRFKLATGTTPLKYLQDLRMSTARELLQTSNLSVSEIAYNVGYQDIGHFSGLFKKSFSATPQDYRTTVRAKLFTLSG